MLRTFYPDKEKKAEYLPVLFDIFHENMQSFLIGDDCGWEKSQWLREVGTALNKDCRKLILCTVDETPVGFLMYCISGAVLMVEELQISRDYRFSGVFKSMCRELSLQLPQNVRFIEAYAHRENLKSLRLMEKRGMSLVDPDKTSAYIHMQGSISPLLRLFKR